MLTAGITPAVAPATTGAIAASAASGGKKRKTKNESQT